MIDFTVHLRTVGYDVEKRYTSSSCFVCLARAGRTRSQRRTVVLKAFELSALDAFERECCFAQRAQEHRYGVPVLDVFSTGQCAVLVLEAYDMTLGQWFDGTRSLAELQLLERLLDKRIARLHADGVVHGDLLPKNVVCRLRGNRLADVALIDFGISFTTEERVPAEVYQVLHDYLFHPTQSLSRHLGIVPSLAEVMQEPTLLDAPLGQFVGALAHDPCFRARLCTVLKNTT